MTMKIALCNEVLGQIDFVEQCRIAAALGYDGLEIAPFTLSSQPTQISKGDRLAYRKIAQDHGLTITGLHWLLTAPEGLSITSADPIVAQKTRDHILGMVELCADLGGSTLVHGSPAQRQIDEEDQRDSAVARATEHFHAAGEASYEAGIVYCIEPLARELTNFINTIDEALAIIKQTGGRGLATMLDTSASWAAEQATPEELLRAHVPEGKIQHIHFNESNKRGPGQGNHQFSSIITTLCALDYRGTIGIEPFDYYPDGQMAAARAIGYIRGLLEMQELRS